MIRSLEPWVEKQPVAPFDDEAEDRRVQIEPLLCHQRSPTTVLVRRRTAELWKNTDA